MARRVALVTGASRGLGHASAVALAAQGFDLFLAAEGTAAELLSVEEHCRRVGPGDAGHGEFDLGEAGAAERMVAAALARFGRVDVLVNNAGQRCPRPFGSFSRAEFDQLVQVNVAAAFFASQAVLPAMRAQGGGRIINMASQMGRVAARGNAVYGLTKAALVHLTRSMALELSADNILVNSISPGPIDVAFNRTRYATDPAGWAALERMVPLGRFGTPGEVAEVVVFLATCDGRFIQGHDVVVDGGYIIQ